MKVDWDLPWTSSSLPIGLSLLLMAEAESLFLVIVEAVNMPTLSPIGAILRIKILIRNNHVCIIHSQTSCVWMPRNYTYFKHEILHLFQRAHISTTIPKDVWAHFSACIKRNKQCNLAPTVHNRCPLPDALSKPLNKHMCPTHCLALLLSWIFPEHISCLRENPSGEKDFSLPINKTNF